MEVLPFAALGPRVPVAPSLREVCQEFEALLLEQMLQAMDRTVSPSGLFSSEGAHRLYRSLWHQALAREVARGGGIGLAELLMERLGAKVLEGSADKVEDPGEGASSPREGRRSR